MRPSVVTAVLLLVCIQDTETASFVKYHSVKAICGEHADEPCGDGWSRIDETRCIKFIGSLKNFSDAEEHCRSLKSELLSVHSEREMMKVLCVSWRADPYYQTIWIGAKGSCGGGYKHADGSEFDYDRWYPGQPDNADGQEQCIESNSVEWGAWNDVHCSEEKFFVCTKKM